VGESEGFDDLLSLPDVDHLIASTALRLPSFRLVKEGKALPSSSYTKTARTGSQSVAGMADPARIFAEFERGATIVLQGMHRYWLPLARFCRDLELQLGHPTQVNAYITPPGSRGLAVHRDGHDVFVLQMFGTKRWQVYARSPDLPPPDDPILETELRPGDSLYIPRDFPHAASTQETASAHLTVGILSPTWIGAVREAVRLAEDEPELAEPLPLGFGLDPAAFRDAVEDRLLAFQRWLEKVDPGEVAERLARGFLTSRQPLLGGQLSQLLSLPALSDRSRVRRRPSSICVILPAGDEIAVLIGDRELRMPAWVEPAVRSLATGTEVTVNDLEPDLDDADSRLVLVRRLVREGMLEVID
jgi:lysine-specific demethylase/histidyl-hydroxylase NO66